MKTILAAKTVSLFSVKGMATVGLILGSYAVAGTMFYQHFNPPPTPAQRLQQRAAQQAQQFQAMPPNAFPPGHDPADNPHGLTDQEIWEITRTPSP